MGIFTPEEVERHDAAKAILDAQRTMKAAEKHAKEVAMIECAVPRLIELGIRIAKAAYLRGLGGFAFVEFPAYMARINSQMYVNDPLREVLERVIALSTPPGWIIHPDCPNDSDPYYQGLHIDSGM